MGNSNGQAPSGKGRGGSFKSLVDRRETGPRLNVILNNKHGELGEAIQAALFGGLGVLISATADGGAISITVYEGDERFRSYASTADEWDAMIKALADAGDAAATAQLQKFGRPRTGR